MCGQTARKTRAAFWNALAILRYKRTLGEIAESLREAAGGVDVALFQRRYFKPILLAFLIAFFNQVSGINAINYYAPRIFQMILVRGANWRRLRAPSAWVW